VSQKRSLQRTNPRRFLYDLLSVSTKQWDYIRKLAELISRYPAIRQLRPLSVLGILHRSQTQGYAELVTFARANPPPVEIGEQEVMNAMFGAEYLEQSRFETERPTKDENPKPRKK
jgi:hypothetical protein